MTLNDITYKINGAVFVDQLHKAHEAQLINYLKATGLNVGLLINFKHPKADIKRFVLALPEGHDTYCADTSSG